MSKTKIVVIGVGIVVFNVILALLVFLVPVGQEQESSVTIEPTLGTTTQESTTLIQEQAGSVPKQTVPSLARELDGAVVQPLPHVVPVFATGTVQEAMLAYEATGAVTYRGEQYIGLGYFLTHINGEAGERGTYWILHINGETSNYGASNARVVPGDHVEWKLQTNY